jgi:hypothetical protein
MRLKAGRRRAQYSILGTWAVLTALGAPVFAAPTYRAIDLTPAGSAGATAHGAGGGRQVGADDAGRAFLWSSSAASATPLGFGVAFAADATSQGGRLGSHAALWHGSAGSVIDLHAGSGYSTSEVHGVGGGQQVGSATPTTGGNTHAALWSGASDTFVDLHPTGGAYSSSDARGISGVRQVGYGRIAGSTRDHALLWTGSPDSATDLNPPGFESSTALAIAGDVTVGDGTLVGGPTHALLWSGPINRVSDLNPTWATASSLFGTNGAQHVGSVAPIGALPHAAVWFGSTPADAIDLHAFLPPEYTVSLAYAVDTNGDVVGFASAGGLPHAFLWTSVPEPTAIPLAGLVGATALRRRRRRPA